MCHWVTAGPDPELTEDGHPRRNRVRCLHCGDREHITDEELAHAHYGPDPEPEWWDDDGGD